MAKVDRLATVPRYHKAADGVKAADGAWVLWEDVVAALATAAPADPGVPPSLALEVMLTELRRADLRAGSATPPPRGTAR